MDENCDDDESDPEMDIRMVPLFNREESMFFLDLCGGELKIHGKSICIEDGMNDHAHDTGNRTWDGGIVLSKVLEKHCSNISSGLHKGGCLQNERNNDLYSLDVRGSNVLELGSGTGLLAIVASYLGAKTSYGTDLKYCLPLLEHNIELNKNHLEENRIFVRELDWFWFSESTLSGRDGIGNKKCGEGRGDTNDAHNKAEAVLDIPVDIILAADVVWQEHLLKPFLKTVSMLLGNTRVQPKSQRKCILLYTDRYPGLKETLLKDITDLGMKYKFYDDYDFVFHVDYRDESMSVMLIYK